MGQSLPRLPKTGLISASLTPQLPLPHLKISTLVVSYFTAISWAPAYPGLRADPGSWSLEAFRETDGNQSLRVNCCWDQCLRGDVQGVRKYTVGLIQWTGFAKVAFELRSEEEWEISRWIVGRGARRGARTASAKALRQRGAWHIEMSEQVIALTFN